MRGELGKGRALWSRVMAAVVAERRGCRASGGRQELAEGEELPFCSHRVPGNLYLDVYSSRFLWSLLRASVIPLQPESRVCAGTLPSRV